MEKAGSDEGSEALLERERAARARAEAERDNLRALFMQMPAAFALLEGPEHRYVLSNPANQEFVGGRELVGQTVREALPELEAHGLMALADHVYKTGEPFVAREVPAEIPATAERPPRTAYINGVYQPVRGANGAVTGLMAFAYEVTDLVNSRRASEHGEERLRLALAAADLGTWDFDPRTGVLTCDNRFRDLFGIAHDAELSAALVLGAIHSDDRERIQAAVRRSFDPSGDGSYSVENRIIGLRDAVERWISVRGRTFFDLTGRPMRFAGAALDVTDQVLARQRLRDAERRATTIADAVPQIIWTALPEGEVDFYNRRWFEYTGLPPGRTGREEWTAVVHPDDLSRIREVWDKSLRDHAPFQTEVRLRRDSDKSYRWHLAQSLPIVAEDGHVLRWVGSSTDIDDQKRVEEITRLLGDAGALLGTSLDTDTALQQLAQLAVPRLADWCSICFVEEGDLAKHKLFVAHVDPEKARWAQELNQKYPPDVDDKHGAFEVVRTGKPRLYSDIPDAFLVATARDPEQLRIFRTLGMRSAMTVPIIARDRTFGAITLVSAESGRVYRSNDIGIAQALAERAAHAIDNARLYAEAQEAVRVRDEFMSLASHELKTPLTPLQLHLQALLQQPSGSLPEKVMKKLDVMGRQVDRLERLVGSLVDIYRLSAKRFEVDREPVDLSKAVQDVARRMAPEVARASSGLTMELPDEVVGLWDQARIEQVVTALLSNALKFGAGKPLEIMLTAGGGFATLVVRDHGIGIEPQDRSRIFERFERAVPVRHYGGFGMGLWIVKQIVDALGGSVSVESELGVGSTFTVILPLPNDRPLGPENERRVH